MLLARSLIEAGTEGPLVDEWWVDVPEGEAASYLAALPVGATAVSTDLLGERLQEAPLRVATQATLWVAIAASTLLAAVGFGVHSAAGLRSRRLELAQLRAIGYSRRRLVGLVATESLLMGVLGVVFGVSIGVLLAWLVGPLVAVSPTGAPTVPSVVVEVPALGIALLVAEVAAVLAAVVVLVSRSQRFTEPAHLLREGVQP
nr:ABC transporter permease [Conyzicola lurida]